MKVGYFGKMPSSADFVAWNAGEPPLAGFEQWLLDGVGLARERLAEAWSARYESSPIIGFQLRAQDRVARGSWVCSHDQSGRQFPLAGFHFASPGEGLQHPLQRAGFPLIDPLQRAAQGQESDLRTSLLAESGEPGSVAVRPPLTLGDLVGALNTDCLPQVLTNLSQLHERAQRGYSLTGFGLRFPLPRGTDQMCSEFLEFWGRLATTMLGQPPYAAFWTGPGNQGGVLDLWVGAPDSLEYLFLICPELDSELIYPLAEGGGASEAMERARGAVSAAPPETPASSFAGNPFGRDKNLP